jgi:cyclopropane-fatty-acyl-phospholipid synthase
MSMLLTGQPGSSELERAPADPIATSSTLGILDRTLAATLQRIIAPAAVRLVLWNGESPFAPALPPVGDLIVRTRAALVGLIVNPNLYFGEAYMTGALDVGGDLVAVLERLSRLHQPSASRHSALLHFIRRNGIQRARHNVHHHYDIGNDFYALWLDRELVYTCAYFPQPDCSLEEAQVAKMDLVCRKLRLQPGEAVVEAGCGWGALALYMARQYGVRVRAFNVSREQIRYARERAQREGLAGRVEFIEDDYRNMNVRCDVFVSVGMLEHVGPRDYATFATLLGRILRRDTGRGLLHFIGRDRPMALNAWIRRRIFPGGHPPALSDVASAILEPAGLSVLDVENLRLHYARTLQHWLTRFQGAEDRVRTTFDESFVRAWRLYLAGSQAAFTTGWMQLFQVVFAPSGGTALHWTREALYNGGGTREWTAATS